MEGVFLALFAHLLWLVPGKVHKIVEMRQGTNRNRNILKGRNCSFIQK